MSSDYEIDVQNEEAYPVDGAALAQASALVLAQHEIAAGTALSIVIGSDDEVRALNALHRGVDAATDVLSFPADPLPPGVGDDAAPYLGDLVIAFPYAAAQAQREGHALAESLALLVVHGTLHLLGYDHDTPGRRAAMWQAQAAALGALGIPEAIVPALEQSDHGH